MAQIIMRLLFSAIRIRRQALSWGRVSLWRRVHRVGICGEGRSRRGLARRGPGALPAAGRLLGGFRRGFFWKGSELCRCGWQVGGWVSPGLFSAAAAAAADADDDDAAASASDADACDRQRAGLTSQGST